MLAFLFLSIFSFYTSSVVAICETKTQDAILRIEMRIYFPTCECISRVQKHTSAVQDDEGGDDESRIVFMEVRRVQIENSLHF